MDELLNLNDGNTICEHNDITLYQQKLNAAVNSFMRPFENYGIITDAIKNLEDVFFSISGLDPFSGNSEYNPESKLSRGVAVSPNCAGMCVRELVRTWKFIQGMILGVKSAMQRFPGERIEILYAGCGPFATLFVPLTSVFSPGEIGVTLLDIHSSSINSVKKIISTLKIEDYIVDCRLTDVFDFNPGPGKKYHMAVTETMNQALRKEPQVSITHHIYPFLFPDGIFIPERVSVSAELTDLYNEFPELHSHIYEGNSQDMKDTGEEKSIHRPKAINLGVVFELIPGMIDYPPVMLSLPRLKNRNNFLVLLTEITVFKDIKLLRNECSLTLPYKYSVLSKIPDADRYTASYEISSNPGIRIKPLE